MIRPFAWLGRPSAQRDAALLTLAVAALYAGSCDHLALGSSNRYVEACREMVELGDWVVPHLAYVPYFEKPILTYWLGAACQWLFGGGNAAAQLPSGLAALVSVLATYALGRQLRGAAFGLAAGLMLLTSVLFMVTTSVLTTDTVLSACLAVAWWTWWSWEDGRLSRPGAAPGGERWIWGFWCALGLAFLAKGPIALVIAGVAIGGYALLAAGPRSVLATLWAMHPLRGLLIIIAINLPWSLAVWMRDPRFLEFFYVRINFLAFFDGKINHPGPPWFYLPVLAAILAPYTLVAVPVVVLRTWEALTQAVRRLGERGTQAAARTYDAAERERRSRLFLVAAVLFPLVFFSISASKLGSYVMPLLPPLVLLAADGMWEWRWARRWWSAMLATMGIALLIALVVVLWVLFARDGAVAPDQPLTLSIFGYHWTVLQERTTRLIDWSYLPLGVAGLAVLVIGVVASYVAAARGRMLASLACLGGALALVVIAVLPRVEYIVRDIDAARLVAVIRAQGGDDPHLPAAERDPVILHKGVVHDYELVHALRRRTFVVDDCREIGMGHFVEVRGREVPLPGPGQPIADPYLVNGESLPDHPWLYSFQRLRDDWHGPRRLWVICHAEFLARLEREGVTFHRIDQARHTMLISNRP